MHQVVYLIHNFVAVEY